MKTSAQSENPPEAALEQAMDRLWVRFLPEIRERVANLEAAAVAVTAKTLSDSGRDAAQAAAHKLAGVLGTFSLTHGTDVARELEVAYSHESAEGAATGKHLATLAAELRTMIEKRKTGIESRKPGIESSKSSG
jgi:HPt (histidine-containing phosphotransfer) domain-containing protein